MIFWPPTQPYCKDEEAIVKDRQVSNDRLVEAVKSLNAKIVFGSDGIPNIALIILAYLDMFKKMLLKCLD